MAVVQKLFCLLAQESGRSRFAEYHPVKSSSSDDERYHETGNDLFIFGDDPYTRRQAVEISTLKRPAARLQIFAAHSLGNTGLGVQKHFTKF